MLGLLAVCGCGYRPPVAGEAAAPGYKQALSACEDSAASAVNKQNAKTGLAWFASPVRRWSQIGDATGTCMDGKGFGRVRWCTADELRSGGGNQVVTAQGVQCSDLPRPKAS